MGRDYQQLSLEKIDARLPGFQPSRRLGPANRGNLGSRAINRLSGAEAQSGALRWVTNPVTPISRPAPGAGKGLAWNAMRACGRPESLSHSARRLSSPSRSRAGSSVNRAAR